MIRNRQIVVEVGFWFLSKSVSVRRSMLPLYNWFGKGWWKLVCVWWLMIRNRQMVFGSWLLNDGWRFGIRRELVDIVFVWWLMIPNWQMAVGRWFDDQESANGWWKLVSDCVNADLPKVDDTESANGFWLMVDDSESVEVSLWKMVDDSESVVDDEGL